MNAEQTAVREFNERAGATVNDWPTVPSEADRDLRVNLIKEELEELRQSGEAGDLVRVADALADLLYVVYGACDTYGIDIEPVFWEVHASNLRKAQVCAECGGSGFGGADDYGIGMDCAACDGTRRVFVKRADGKILKGEDWRPPELAPIIQAQECRPYRQEL